MAADGEKGFHEVPGDRQCWLSFSGFAVLFVGFAALYVYSLSDFTKASIELHSLEYFVLCTLGGVLSGIPHTITTPIDLVKCRVQCGEYASATEGYRSIWNEGSPHSSTLTRVSMYFRGWAPTLIGYSLQGAAKFGLYEYFKHFYAHLVGPALAAEHRVALFFTASACAEVFADIFLSPWEAVKVKMQTTRLHPPLLAVIVPRVYYTEGLNGFFKGLVPLWGRQVPYTMMKFASFEKLVEIAYTVIISTPKSQLPKSAQLVVSLVCGFLAGMLCAVVSHPADTLVSKLNQKNDGRQNVLQVAQDLGCTGLWKGLPLRLAMIGTITALQWVIYDSFKVFVGLPTTGGAHQAHPLVTAPVVGGH